MSRTALSIYLDPYRTSRLGFSSVDAESVEPTPELHDLVLQSLNSREFAEVNLSGTLLQGLAQRPDFAEWCDAPLVEALWGCASDSNPLVVASALRTLGRLGLPYYRDHRDLYLQSLASAHDNVRQAALEGATPEVIRSELAAFLKFSKDTYIQEIAMGGPLRFILRDLALAKIEEAFGASFRTKEATKSVESYGPVSYWAWDHRRINQLI